MRERKTKEKMGALILSITNFPYQVYLDAYLSFYELSELR